MSVAACLSPTYLAGCASVCVAVCWRVSLNGSHVCFRCVYCPVSHTDQASLPEGQRLKKKVAEEMTAVFEPAAPASDLTEYVMRGRGCVCQGDSSETACLATF